VTTLGAGTLNEQVRVLLPTEIVARTKEYRDIEADVTAAAESDGYSRWELVEQGLDLLPPDRWLSAVLLIDPGDGHRIVFHPDAPDDLFFIEHEDEVHRIGSSVGEGLTWFLESGPWGVGRHIEVLLPDGQFVARPVRYFEPDRDRASLMFNLQRTGTFPKVSAYLLTLARQDPSGTVFLRETETAEDEGSQGEVLHLFVQEYGGAVWCNDAPIIKVSYDRERQTPSLDRLLDFCRSRANPTWV
jgi:hypothetical protein